jgi:uncharacterized protein (TIGR03437 family)
VRVLICFLASFPCFSAGVLAFEARDGQYVSHGPGYALSVTSGGAILSLMGHAVTMSVAGASPKSSLEALDRMPGRANYLFGSDVRASYDLFGRVLWRGVYAGIDVLFRGNQEHLEYDFEIDAGRDPGTIKVGFGGVDEIRIDPDGDLVLQVGEIQIHQPKPVAYQIIAGQKRPVDVVYWLDASSQVRFRTGAYDHQHALVIDPQIVFDNSFGGSGKSSAAGLARDTQGNLYVAGTTNSTNLATLNAVQSHLGTAPLLVTADAGKTWSYPSLGGASSVSVIAAAPSAPMIFYAATPVGVFKSADGGTTWTAAANAGLVGPATALAVDASSASTVFAATVKGVFVSTDAGASWRASTNGIPGASILALATQPGQTGTVFASTGDPLALFRSTDFGQSWTKLTIPLPAQAPTNEPNSPIVAIVCAPGNTVIVATYVGLEISTDGGNTWTAGAFQQLLTTQVLAIAPSNPSILYLDSLAGLQKSTDGGQTFAVVLPSTSSANSSQEVGAFAIDPRNPAIVFAVVTEYSPGISPANMDLLERSTDGGQTWSQIPLPYPVIPQSLFISPVESRVFLEAGTFNNVFVTKWSPDGSQVLYSTYLGGSGSDGASGIAVDGTGSAYVVGFTSSPDFPTTLGAFKATLSDPIDVFTAKLSPDGSKLMYSTLLGSGSQFDTGGIAVDGAGAAVITGLTRGNYPVTANAFQPTLGPGCPTSEFDTGSAFVTKIAPDGKALLYSTYLGGSCPLASVPVVAPATYGTSVTVDASGNAWVAGGTLSVDFPVTSDALQSKFGGGLYDGYLARFNPSGGLDYATYLGGPGYDIVNAIAFDSSGNIFLTGESAGLSQPASVGAFQPQASASCPIFSIGPSFPGPSGNALVLKLDPAAHSVQRLTYLGAPLCLSGAAIAVDSAGEPWIAGSGGAPQTASPFKIGIGSGFVSKFSADFTELLFSTYFDLVSGLALDSSGAAYVAGTGASNNSTGAQAVYVAKIDSTPPLISLDSVVSAVPIGTSGCLVSSCAPQPSTFQGIAAGEVIRLLGKQMGPAAPTRGIIQSGVLATNVAGIQVTFDGVAAPLLSVSAQEIDLVAPFELATKSATTIQVQYNGVQSNAVQIAVTSTILQILGVFNEDFSVNSASNPAKAGSMMILYLSGAGQTNPPSRDGQVNAAPLPAPGMPVQVQWSDSYPTATILPVSFAGAAPGLAAGIFQVNFVAPQQSLMNVDLILGTIGTQSNGPQYANTQFNVWVK